MKRIIKAAFKLKNLELLGFVGLVTYFTGFLPFLFIGLAGYVYFLMQTLQDPGFQKDLSEQEQLDSLYALNNECSDLYGSIRRQLGTNERERVKRVLREKDELMGYFRSQEDDGLTRKIVEQALNLVLAYTKLTYNYSMRDRELAAANLNGMVERINRNNRRLGTLKSYAAVQELTRAIEMDEKVLERLRHDKMELEQISAKLDYIESTIGVFKHRIISNDELNPAVEDIETVINEASALDNVLTERKRQREHQ